MKGASRGLEGGFKGASGRGLLKGVEAFSAEGGFEDAEAVHSSTLNTSYLKYVPKQSIPKHFEHELRQRFGIELEASKEKNSVKTRGVGLNSRFFLQR